MDLPAVNGEEAQCYNRSFIRIMKSERIKKKECPELITICDKLPEGVKFSPVPPYAFTEHGVTMSASIIKSKRAVQMNIAIVRAFIALKQFVLNYKDLAEQIKQLRETTCNHNIKLNKIYEALENLLNEKAEQQKWQNRE